MQWFYLVWGMTVTVNIVRSLYKGWSDPEFSEELETFLYEKNIPTGVFLVIIVVLWLTGPVFLLAALLYDLNKGEKE